MAGAVFSVLFEADGLLPVEALLDRLFFGILFTP